MSEIESETIEPSEPSSSVRETPVYVSTAKPKAPLTEEELANMEKPKVLIVGAGIGGLMLGNILQKGGIPYDIYERSKEVKPLGKEKMRSCLYRFCSICIYIFFFWFLNHPTKKKLI